MGVFLNATMIGLAVITALGLLWLGRRRLNVSRSQPQIQILGAYSPVLTWLRNQLAGRPNTTMSENGTWVERFSRASSALLNPQAVVVEWIIIVVWGLFIGQKYLNTNPTIWPAGYGLGIKLIGHQFWINLKQCGLCALWNGGINGGHPAFADLFGSQFHPLIVLPTLIWGVINGLKFGLVGTMILAGLGQWWIARALDLGRAARVWSGLLAVVGGHLATQQWEGNFGLSLAFASAACVIAASIALAKAPSHRKAVVLAIMGAVFILSGQGYIQAGLVAWAPAVLFLLLNKTRAERTHVLREFVIAVGLSLLLTAFVIIPTIHYWPNFTKDASSDPTFAFAQPVEYIFLNFLIRDGAYFQTANVLGKPATADLPFVGWIPILFGWLSLRFAKVRDVPALGFLTTGAIVTILLTGAVPQRWISNWSPYALWLKNVWVFSGLAVVPILAIGAFGLDRVLQLKWPNVQLAVDTNHSAEFKFDTKWLLIIPLAAAVWMSYGFANGFMVTQDLSKMYTQYISHYHTPTTEWVSPPFAEPVWTQPGLDNGFKLTNQEFSGSRWAGRDLPPAYLISVRGDLASTKPFEQVDAIDQLPVYRIPLNEYAFVTYADGTIQPCQGHATGGFITVNCVTDRDGMLTVTENVWGGWNAWLDGHGVPVLTRVDANARWLGAVALAGPHTYVFEFLPWDAFLGLLVTLLGTGLAAYFWFARRESAPGHPAEERSLA